MEQLMDINELCEKLKVSKYTVYSWISQKKIPVVKVGRLVRFNSRKIDEWLNSKTVDEQILETRKFLV